MAGGTVDSADGTTISFEIHGKGVPLVIVPGALAPPELYRPLADLLAGGRQVVIIERRGYGTGDQGPRPCRIGYHVDDLVAVLSTLDEPATVFGHSFGGLVVLEAAGAEQIRNLAIHEPPYGFLGETLLPTLEKGREAVAGGRPEDAVAAMLTVTGSVPAGTDEMVGQISRHLAWRAEGLLSDLECVTSTTADPEQWAKIEKPVLLMCGGSSSTEDKSGVFALHDLLPHAKLAEIPGQTHFPEDMAPVAELLTQLG
jgi:pimeloyl-ACP methyl ester carboxylesterase